MDVDVSSYRTEPQPSSLDIAGKLGRLKAQAQGIERQGIGIESDKLKLANERLGVLAKEYTTLLADNDVMQGTQAAPAKVQAMGQRMVNLGVIPANMFGEFAKSIPTDAKAIPQFIQQQMARVQSIGEAITYHQGSLGPTIDNNQTQQPTRWSPKTGLTAEGAAIQTQVPVTAPVLNKAGQQVMQGPTENVAVPGTVSGPPNRLPVGPPAMPAPNVNAGPAPVPNKDQSRVPAPSGPATGQPVSFETNRLAHVKDYEESNGILQATRPLLKAYKLIDEFNPRTGPTTGKFNEIVAALKSNNFIPTETKNDPTAIYQEINKYLAQSVKAQGAPSDAQQAQLLAGSPDAKTQILPALKKLTYDTIALQRGRAILPYMYSSTDYGKKNYHEEKGRNVNQLSEQALMLDHIKSDDERDALLDEMRKKRKTKEGRDFELTLEAMKRGNMNIGQ